MERGQSVILLQEQYPFYWNYAGNPDVILPVSAIGIIAHPKTQGDIIIDFPVDMTGLSVISGYHDRTLDTIWRVRMSSNRFKLECRKCNTPEWLSDNYFFSCGGLKLNNETKIPFMFNRKQ